MTIHGILIYFVEYITARGFALLKCISENRPVLKFATVGFCFATYIGNLLGLRTDMMPLMVSKRASRRHRLRQDGDFSMFIYSAAHMYEHRCEVTSEGSWHTPYVPVNKSLQHFSLVIDPYSPLKFGMFSSLRTRIPLSFL